MARNYTYIAKSLEDTYSLASVLSRCVKRSGAIMLFVGEIGTGKTTFIKKFLKDFGVLEDVTSPSFVIMNEYHSAKMPVYHFDLYRLENIGTHTIQAELLQYSNPGSVLLVEWAQFNDLAIFDDRLLFEIEYKEDGCRKFTIQACGSNSRRILKRLKDYENSKL